MLDIYISELIPEKDKILKKYIVHCIYLSLISEIEINTNNIESQSDCTDLNSEKEYE